MQYATDSRYDLVARLLHWLIVALVAAQFVIGWTMPDVHRGSALIAAMACRLIWRATHRPPPVDQTPLMRAVASLTHVGLYGLLVAVPVLGWINASSRAWAVTLFAAIPLPALSPAGSSFGHAMGDVHSVLAWVLFALICLHVAAALFHRFVLNDQILQRMKL
jgi:cytochrome b561